MRPLLLDLFCGAGGAAMGYYEAGFDVIGVDIAAQPRYPFPFIQADALHPPLDLAAFDAIHASPPCQAYTSMRRLGRGVGEGAPELVEETREMLRASGKAYVIENVQGAPLLNPMRICASGLGLPMRRHRLFESNVALWSVACSHKPDAIAVYGDHAEDAYLHRRDLVSPGATRRAATLKVGQDAMGIDWMPWRSLTQAIPPAYTRFIGEQLLTTLTKEQT